MLKTEADDLDPTRVIAATAMPSPCARMERQIEEYVEAQWIGENARAMFPAVWSHLHGCALCRQEYAAWIAEGTEE